MGLKSTSKTPLLGSWSHRGESSSTKWHWGVKVPTTAPAERPPPKSLTSIQTARQAELNRKSAPGGHSPNHGAHLISGTGGSMSQPQHPCINRSKHDSVNKTRFLSARKSKREKTVQCLFLLSLHRDLPEALTVQSGEEKVRTVPQNDQQGTLSKSSLPLFVSPAP